MNKENIYIYKRNLLVFSNAVRPLSSLILCLLFPRVSIANLTRPGAPVPNKKTAVDRRMRNVSYDIAWKCQPEARKVR